MTSKDRVLEITNLGGKLDLRIANKLQILEQLDYSTTANQ